MNKTNKFFLIVFAIIALCDIVFIFTKKQPEVIINEEAEVAQPQEEKGVDICYYRSDKTTNGLYDKAWLKLNLVNGDKVTGEFNNIPAEKDSKIGTFEGTVGQLDQKIMGRHASVWWNSYAEGMNNTEELSIDFGDGSATVGFGEMVDRGDGVYVYKNKDNLYYIKAMNQIDCKSLDEKLFAEKYVRDNIKGIATNKPALGGSWYTTSVLVNPISHTGEVSYEDGHKNSKAIFIYTYEKIPQNITITKFEIVK